MSGMRTWTRRLSLGVALGALGVVAFGCLTARDRHRGYDLDVARPAGLDVAPGPFRVGFGRRSISPPIVDRFVDADGDARYEPKKGDSYVDGNGNGRFDPCWLAGFHNNRPATGVHDDLEAIAMVLDDGRTRVAIVALDAIGLMYDEVIEIRRRLPADWQVQHAIVCSTHCHEVPDLMGLWGPSPLRSGVDPVYLELVRTRTVEAIGEAVSKLEEAQVRLLQVEDVREGLVTDTRRPHVYDADVRIMQFLRPADRTTIGALVTWGNHPETAWSRNLEVTADYVGYLRDGVEKGIRYGEREVRPGVGGTVLFVNGAVGGLMTTHASLEVRDPFLDRAFREPSHEKARAVGYRVADAVLGALAGPGGTLPGDPRIRWRAKTIRLPVSNRLFKLASRLGVIDRGFTGWSDLRSEVDLLTVGDAWMVTVPGEIYPEIVNGGIESPPGADFGIAPVEVPPLRELMGGKVNFVFGLANDEVGYIIPKSEWDRKEPYLYNAEKGVYGEVNSVGPEAGLVIHQAIADLIRAEMAAAAQPRPQP